MLMGSIYNHDHLFKLHEINTRRQLPWFYLRWHWSCICMLTSKDVCSNRHVLFALNSMTFPNTWRSFVLITSPKCGVILKCLCYICSATKQSVSSERTKRHSTQATICSGSRCIGRHRGRRSGPRWNHQRTLCLHHRGGWEAGRGSLLCGGSKPCRRGHCRYQRESCR